MFNNPSSPILQESKFKLSKLTKSAREKKNMMIAICYITAESKNEVL